MKITGTKQKKTSKSSSFKIGKFSTMNLLVLVLVFAAAGGYFIHRSYAATNFYVSTTGNDSNACSQAAPCLTFNRAYAVASAGDTVIVQPGSYPSQTVSGTKPSCCVIFDLQNSATVSGITVHSNNVEFRNGTISDYGWNGTATNPIPSNVTFRNITAQSAFFNAGTNLSIIGGSIGNYVASSGLASAVTIEGTSNPLTNVLFDGVDFHDISHAVSTDHFEGLRVEVGVSNLTVRNSKFRNILVNTAVIFITNVLTDPGDPHDITFENNWFGDPVSGAGGGAFFDISTQNPVIQTCTNLKFRYNSFVSEGVSLACASASGTQFVGNTGPSPAGTSAHCPTLSGGIIYSHNVFTDQTCGATDKHSAALNYVNSATTALDLHLTAGSAAIDAGDPGDFPAKDIDGQNRPAGAGPDAGADEFGAATGPKVGDLNGDGSVDIIDLSILLSHFGGAGTPSTGDLNSDNTVNITDLSILLSHYGT